MENLSNSTPFDQAIDHHNSNPCPETMENARKKGFEAISDGVHKEDYVATRLASLKPLQGIQQPYDVAGEALKALRDIAFFDVNHVTTVDDIIEQARIIISKGVMLEPAVYSFMDKKGTPEESVLLTLSAQGFFFAGDIPENDLSQRFVMLVNNILTQFYNFHYERGYNSSVADGFIDTNAIEVIQRLIPAAHRSNRNKDKVIVKEAKAFLENLKEE